MRRPASTQTDPVKTKMMKDEKIDNQAELIGNRNQTTETDEDLLTIRTKDGDCEKLFELKSNGDLISFLCNSHHHLHSCG